MAEYFLYTLLVLQYYHHEDKCSYIKACITAVFDIVMEFHL